MSRSLVDELQKTGANWANMMIEIQMQPGLCLEIKNNTTPLILAIRGGYTNLAKQMISMGDKCNMSYIGGPDKQTALAYAIDQQDWELAQLFLAHDPDDVGLEYPGGKFNRTPLQMALFEAANKAVVHPALKSLIDAMLFNKHDCNLTHVEKSGNTALMVAMRTGYAEWIREIASLDADQCNVYYVGPTNYTAFMLGCQYSAIGNQPQKEAALIYVLDRFGTQLMLDVANDTNGKTALIYACQQGLKDLVRKLATYPIDLYHKDKKGQTAFDFAKAEKLPNDILDLLRVKVLDVKSPLTGITYKTLGQIGSASAYATVMKVENDKGEFFANKIANRLDKIQYQEVDMLRRIEHPAILNAVDLYYTGDNLNIIMPLADGDLTGEKESGKISPETLVRWCYEIASGMEFLHKNGFYHCDLKSDNILIKGGKALVADFGIGGSIRASWTDMSFCGTPSWYPAETNVGNILSDGATSVAAKKISAYKREYKLMDLYALGVLFTYILGDINEHIIQWQGNWWTTFKPMLTSPNKVIDNWNFVAGLDMQDEWRALFKRMLHPDPEKRPGSITDILNDPVFAARVYNVPVPGRVVDVAVDAKIDKGKWIQAMEKPLKFGQTYKTAFLTMYMWVDLMRRYGMDNVYMCAAGFLAYKCNINDDSIDERGLVNNEAFWAKSFSVKADDVKDAVKQIVGKCGGKIRRRYVYDIAVSEEEVLWGLLMLIKPDATYLRDPADLHYEYCTVVESPDDQAKRTPVGDANLDAVYGAVLSTHLKTL
jgi:ankyrin repeat protein